MICTPTRRTPLPPRCCTCHRTRLNSTVPSARLPDTACLLPQLSSALTRTLLRHWERAAREQTFMCNQAAGLSRCLTKIQDTMVTQHKTLYLDKGKGKAPGRSQQAVGELDYMVTFDRSITQAMARTMQDLSKGIFVNMANLTLARRGSYLEYLRTGVKQDNITALHTAPPHTSLTK